MSLLPAVVQNPRGTSPVLVAVVTGAAAMVLAALISAGVTLYLMARTPEIVSFDMKQTLDAFTQSASKQALTPQASEALATRFAATLHASLNDYQRAHNVVILVQPAVITGAKDVTSALQRDIALRMQRGNITSGDKDTQP